MDRDQDRDRGREEDQKSLQSNDTAVDEIDDSTALQARWWMWAKQKKSRTTLLSGSGNENEIKSTPTPGFGQNPELAGMERTMERAVNYATGDRTLQVQLGSASSG